MINNNVKIVKKQLVCQTCLIFEAKEFIYFSSIIRHLRKKIKKTKKKTNGFLAEYNYNKIRVK